MKKTKLFIALCLVGHLVSAQTTTEAERVVKNEVGVNSTAFFRQFLNIANTQNLFENPFLVTYKHHFKAFILRGGVGFRINTTSESNPKFSDTKMTANNDVSCRIGYEKQFTVYKKLRGYWGADLVGAYFVNNLRIDSGFDIVTTSDNTWSAGAGGVLGIEYEWGKRFALGTETTYYYRYEVQQQKARFSNNPEFNNSGRKLVGQKTQFLPPLSIFAVLKF